MKLDLRGSVNLRRSLHNQAEGENLEFKTQQKILNYFFNIGVEEKDIYLIAKSGLIIQIYHPEAPFSLENIKNSTIIALRADIDGL